MANNITTLPTEERLRSLLKSGEDCVSIVQGMIDKNSLPFIIIQSDEDWGTCHNQELVDGKCPICEKLVSEVGKKKTVWSLRSTYSEGELYLQKFITIDPATIKMKEDCAKMAATPYEVLIIGETGTGKEILAKSQIDTRKGELKAINCAGMPRELMEAELFGYLAGAFTGANKTTDGLIVAANDGVMFFDEIGELPLDMQSKLLRVLQEKCIRKVGGKVDEKVNCKFVFATNRNIEKMVSEGRFKEDLYARISTLELHVDNLKKRRCDAVPIAESLPGGNSFLEKYKDELESGVLNLRHNVRSVQKYIIQYNVLGKLINEV